MSKKNKKNSNNKKNRYKKFNYLIKIIQNNIKLKNKKKILLILHNNK
jgi:hypothetical protein